MNGSAPYLPFNFDELMRIDPATMIGVVGSEKAAEAAGRMLTDPRWFFTAPPDGAGIAETSWKLLTRFPPERIIWWPTADRQRFVATREFRKLFPQAKIVDTTGLAEIRDGFDATDLEARGEADLANWIVKHLGEPEREPETKSKSKSGPGGGGGAADADAKDSRPGRILSGAAFVARHKPPVWLIDGVIQRGRLYSCTSLTGHGKTAVWLYAACMIHIGRDFGPLATYSGNVLYLAGENPSDLEARLLGLGRHYEIEPQDLPFVLPHAFPMTDAEAVALRREIDALGFHFVLIILDTAASFFPGDNENDNVQAGYYGRVLRLLGGCNGNPAVIAQTHPTKGANADNLQPRGGGAFLNELDGDLNLWSESLGEVTQLRLGSKLRGPPFNALDFRLESFGTGLSDETGRAEITIVAIPISEEEAADRARRALAEADLVLRILAGHPDLSYADIANKAGWVFASGAADRSRVQRRLKALARDGLVNQPRKGGPWKLTDKGKDEIPDEDKNEPPDKAKNKPTKKGKNEPSDTER